MLVLIIEENPDWALQLKQMVDQFGYQLAGIADSLKLARQFLKTQPIDLILCDVVIDNTNVLNFLQNHPPVSCPVIITTSQTDESLYNQAVVRKDTRFLVKPFHRLTLQSAIQSVATKPTPPEEKKGIVVRGSNNQRIVVALDTIRYISVEKNYCFLFTRDRKYAQKISLTRLMQQLDERFVQVHKRFCINSEQISRTDFQANQIFISGDAIPISYTYRKSLVGFLAEN